MKTRLSSLLVAGGVVVPDFTLGPSGGFAAMHLPTKNT